MEQRITRRDHIAVVKRLLLQVILPVSAVVAIALGLAVSRDIPASDLLRDPSATLDGAWYVGLFSTTGIALWAAAAAICLLSLATKPSPEARALLIAGAAVSLMLGADDAYLIHETLKNEVGIPSPVTIALYGVVAVVLFARGRRFLATRENLSVFVVALVLFATSALLDFAGEAGLPTPPLSAIIEDVAKFLGIATWVAFFARVGRDLIVQASTSESVRPASTG